MIFSNTVKPVQCKSDIAILMATYNGAKFIDEQIESILKQSFTNWELFIHDDGSTDQTKNIIKSYACRYPKKIHVLLGESTGNSKNNFFYLMKKVDAQYIMFADQDDVWLKDKIRITYNRLLDLENKKIGTPVLVFSDLKVVDSKLRIISPRMSEYQGLKMDNTDFNHLMIQNVVTGCTVMINEKCKEMAVSCLTKRHIIMHDWWCALIASYFGKIGYINDALILYRQHSVNSVGAKNIHSVSYIKEKLIEDRDQKESLLKAEKQIADFIASYNLKNEYIITFSKFSELNKFRRILFLIKNNIWKSGILRNIGLLYFC